METPHFSGLGQLNQVLNALNINNLEPVWTLKQTPSKIYLDIVWFKLPATTHTRTEAAVPVAQHQPQSAERKSLDCVTPLVVTAPSPARSEVETGTGHTAVKKKKKSPSTRKRDRARFEKWKQTKKGNITTSSCKLQSQTEQTSPTPRDSQGVTSQDKANIVSVTELNSNASDLLTLDCTPSSKPQAQIQDPHVDLERTAEQEFQDSETLPNQSSTSSESLLVTKETNLEEFWKQTEREAESLGGVDRCFNFYCMKPATEVPGGLKKCTRCYIAEYCSRNCQAAHWKAAHRTVCGKFQD